MFGRRAKRSTATDGDVDLGLGSPIELDGVVVHRGRRVALRDVSFALEPGSLTAVVGPNGAGKSSLFGVITGRLQPSVGAVRTLGPVAEVLQSTEIDDQLRLTVEDVVRMGRYPSSGLLGRLRAHDREIVHDALAATNLHDLRRRPITELSGGQRQRVLVAQGLAQRAPILLLDEPAAGLDRRSQVDLLDIIRAETDRGTTVLFATHDLDDTARADNLIVLACDCLCCAPPEAALATPAVVDLFGAHSRPRPRLFEDAADADRSSVA